MKKTLIGLVMAASLAFVSGCSSWDNPTSSQTQKLADSLNATQDPHQVQGVSRVDTLSEVEPVISNPKPALPVELTDADGYEVSVWKILPASWRSTYTARTRRSFVVWA